MDTAGHCRFHNVNVLAAYIVAGGELRLNLGVSYVSVIVTIPLDLTLTPKLDIAGASIASTAFYSLSALTLGLFKPQNRRTLGRDLATDVGRFHILTPCRDRYC